MLRVCSQCSLYYSRDIKMSTASGENNSPNSSDQYDDEFSQTAGQFGEESDDGMRGNGCIWLCTRSNAIVDTTTAVLPANSDQLTLKAPGAPTADNTTQHVKENNASQSSRMVNSKEALAGSISYVSKTDPAPQRRASLTYHISGSVKLLPDTRDNDDSTTNRPKAPVWYLGGTFPLNSNPIRNIGRLPMIESQESTQTRPPLDRQKAIRALDGEDANGNSNQLRRAASTESKRNMKRRKRKKILSKRIEAKKCYSSGGVYLGPS